MKILGRKQFIRIAVVAVACLTFVALPLHATWAQIPVPADAPKPLAPEESVKRFQVPEGFRVELVAAEPIVREPTGICWDARGRLFVCELHGYNMDGQLDIEELNKTGKLDYIPRRIHASEEIREAAKQFMYGTVKMLTDSDGDGRMDQSVVFADRLPPSYGICPARDGLIVVGQTDIRFLADRDGDGQAEVHEVLFRGFPTGGLERGINCPQWGLDDWIYVGRGHGGGKITGPYLKEPVQLPHTDFRIKADGSAIEPVLGSTGTIGFAFTDRGERFTVTTTAIGLHIAPLPWKYLARNPDLSAGRVEERIGDTLSYPTSQPHPWRKGRSKDPGFAGLYRPTETAPNGYFTSCCSPLVYQSDALPDLVGQYLVCEPAQNLIHREVLQRHGPRLRSRRVPGEEKSEFLTSTDQWFNPVFLAHAPDGSIAICDFYREIIEDYSAVPRYLQQQYGLKNGNDHGRIWRLTHRDAPAAPSADMSKLSPEELADELASNNFWRRQTAKRLIIERKQVDAAPRIAKLITPDQQPAAVINALYALEALGKLSPEDILAALESPDYGVRIHALRLSEAWLDKPSPVLDKVVSMIADPDSAVVLQLALTLGESRHPKALDTLVDVARQCGDIHWIDVAILSSLSGKAGIMLERLLADETNLGYARSLIEPLAAVVASGRDPEEVSKILALLPNVEDRALQMACLRGMQSRIKAPIRVSLSTAAVRSLSLLADSSDEKLASLAHKLTQKLKVESRARREHRIATALEAIVDIQLPVEERLAAIEAIVFEDDPQVTQGLLAAAADATPKIRETILEAIFSRRDRLPAVVSALELNTLPGSALSAMQRSALLDHPDAQLRTRAAKLLKAGQADDPELFARYALALKNERNASRGGELFGKHCGACHQAHGLGSMVGPDLTAENKRAEETMLQDILTPSATITAGYATYTITTKDGQVFTGLLAAESASDITLKQQEGKTYTILRKDIDEIQSNPISLMPDNLAKTLSPEDVADILAWLKQLPNRQAQREK